MVVFFIIIRAEKVNAYYLYIGQIKTSSSVDRSFVCCSESFDRHMEPHNSIFAKIRGARFAPLMGAMPHPTSSSYNQIIQNKQIRGDEWGRGVGNAQIQSTTIVKH